ncbi:hypothetical protein LCGC14_1559740 [marine sediment metagenome]|uniref:UspA domain-containing protein n=1 Tax=marine sediment metagenome TaxID=412755 RepID=A0A0F9IMW3_9ZZZZ
MSCNILVLTDFSNDSYNALFYATQLYTNQRCSFHILHAFDHQSHLNEENQGRKITKNILESFSESTSESLRETYHKIMGDTAGNPKHNFVLVQKNSTLKNAVKDYLWEHPIDLIVMGTKGRTGALDIFFGGSTILMIKGKIDCPLLFIPKQIDYRPISQIVYITSFLHNLKKDRLKTLKSIASNYKASLCILHIDNGTVMNTIQERNKEFLSTYLEATKLSFKTVPCDSSKVKTLVQFAKRHKVDLLVMYYHPHLFFDELFREPVLLDLSLYTEIPLLILPYGVQKV